MLGCTEYELAAGLIGAALPGATLFRSAAAVAAQALRRIAAAGADTGPHRTPSPAGTVRVLLSGRQAGLPEAALHYSEGRLLASLAAGADEDRPAPERRADDDRAAEDERPGDEVARPVPPRSVPA